MKCDFLIVGAGLAGSILAERIATQMNRSVIIVDRRFHIGGNCYDYRSEDGVLIHKYGPHIFHTSNYKQFEYISSFTDWHLYYHTVLGSIDGKLVPIPFNFNSLYELFPQKFAQRLEKKLISKYGFGVKIPILKLKEERDEEIHFLADYVYRNVFLNYTLKQWGLSPEELDPTVTSRIPVFLSRDNRYFQDTYQGIPRDGYTKIFERMLNHPNIKVFLNTDYADVKDEIKHNYLIYTGAIDEFFDYKFGELPYRSLRFSLQKFDMPQYQPVAQVNYPNNQDYTRITEFKHFLPYKTPSTIVAFEYPEQFQRNKNERFYPIPRSENRAFYEKYLELTNELASNTLFVGRLAEYRYYNMNEVVGIALMMFENKIRNLKLK